jgi:hypothetical protein
LPEYGLTARRVAQAREAIEFAVHAAGGRRPMPELVTFKFAKGIRTATLYERLRAVAQRAMVARASRSELLEMVREELRPDGLTAVDASGGHADPLQLKHVIVIARQ